MRTSRDPAARRRLAALSCAAAAALVAGIAIGAASGGEEDGGEAPGEPACSSAPAKEPALDGLTLRQKVGQLLVLSFPGTALPPYVRGILGEGRAAGVILFGGNAQSAPQVRSLTGQVQRAARGGALVATDQEGGDIRILRFAAPESGQAAQGDEAGVRRAAATGARNLRAAGVNVNLAPVADVPAGASVMRGRAYAGGPREIGERVAAAVEAHRRARVAATVKHFPGFGRATSNTDDQPVTIPAARADLEADLAPFEAAVKARAPLVMAAHALYPAYDRVRIASQSPVILGELLRERLGFGGAVISDSMEADAVLARSSVETAAVRSVDAGVDIVLMTGPGSYPKVYRRLLAAARRSERFRRRVEESAGRVIALKRRLGLKLP